jgi:electron transfer flavoprotein beta subunit
MNIFVLVKQVPDTTEIKVDKETGTLIRAGVPTIINPDDLAGVELALELKSTHGGSVSVLSMGPPQAETMMRELYAMGVDDAYLLTDRKFAGSDTWATSTILSSFLKTQDYDLIIAGRQAIDGDTAQVGPQVAEFLDLPQASYVKDIKSVTDKDITVVKAYETFDQTLNLPFPALITTLKEARTPRYMNVKAIMGAYDKPVHIITKDHLPVNEKHIGLKGSPTRVFKTFTKPVQEKQKPIKTTSEDAAQKILDAISGIN